MVVGIVGWRFFSYFGIKESFYVVVYSCIVIVNYG